MSAVGGPVCPCGRAEATGGVPSGPGDGSPVGGNRGRATGGFPDSISGDSLPFGKGNSCLPALWLGGGSGGFDNPCRGCACRGDPCPTC